MLCGKKNGLIVQSLKEVTIILALTLLCVYDALARKLQKKKKPNLERKPNA